MVKTILTYRNGSEREAGSEIDLALETRRNGLFSIAVQVNGKTVFTAFHWENMPERTSCFERVGKTMQWKEVR